MQIIMLAAGVGSRLSGYNTSGRPKCLLEFDGLSLLERHLSILKSHPSISRLTMVVGYRSADIRHAVARLAASDFVQFVDNPDYSAGTLLSLACATPVLKSGDDVVVMDADVLYDPEVLLRVINSKSAGCIPFDRDFEPGDEPVKVCMLGSQIVDFGKNVSGPYDLIGEWPGFIHMSSGTAAELSEVMSVQLKHGKRTEPCETAIREILQGREDIEVVDVSGLPWLEIDFPEDLTRATEEILPRLKQRGWR